MREKQQIEEDLRGYLDWITQAEDIEPEGEELTNQDGKLLNEMESNNQLEEGEINQESWSKKKKKELDRVNRRLRRACRKAVKSQAFYWLIIALVFLNTGVLATEHYKQPKWLDQFQGRHLKNSNFGSPLLIKLLLITEATNTFFVTLFTMEMFLKMYSLGFQVRCSLKLEKFLNNLDFDFRDILYHYLIVLIVSSLLEVLEKWF